MRSDVIRVAAMKYPKVAAAAPEPPMSLTASDGTGLRLVSLDARAVVEGPLALTELRMSFENPRDRIVEGRFAITLPPGAAVSRLAMKLDTGWQEAEVVEKQQARMAYEDALHRRQDPALLEKEAGNEFRARIFPIPARGVKEIVLTYSEELPKSDAHYKLRLRGLPAIDKVHASLLFAGKRTELADAGKVPDKDFDVPVPATLPGLRNEEMIVARVRPALSSSKEKIDALTILFDTSASRALGFAAEVERLGRLVERLRSQHGGEMRLRVATFDQEVVPVFEGSASEFGKAALDSVLARRPLGASDVSGALGWLARTAKGGRALLVTDGIATAGSTGEAELATATRALRDHVERLDVLLVGGIKDDEAANRLARGGLAKDGIVLDGALADEELAARMGLTTASGISVEVPGAAWVWPERLDGVQPGDEVLVYAVMTSPSTLAPGKPLSIKLGGAAPQRLDVALAQTPRPLIERAAASAEIARLSSLRAHLAKPDAARRAELDAQIVRISTRFRVLSDATALLVLETDADYDRFHIDRHALAGILSVGDKGVEVVRRTKPVVAVARAPEPRTKAKAPPKSDSFRAKEDSGRSARGARPEPPRAASRPPTDAPREMDEERKPDDSSALGGAAPAAPGGAAAAHNGDGDHDSRPDVADRGPTSPAPPPPPPPPPPAAQPRMEARAADAAGPSATSSPNATSAPSGVPGAPWSDPDGRPPYSGKMAELMKLVAARQTEAAIVSALAWQSEEPGDVMALVALGEALEAHEAPALAARAYGSLLDLFPTRADMRRFAAQRLERLGAAAGSLAVDAYAKAASERPDHLSVHRLLAYALVRKGDPEAAFAAIEAGLQRSYPAGRFLGGERILREDLGIVGAVWLKKSPDKRASIEARLSALGATLATAPSLRFVLTWETDANDVDFHISDAKGGHAFYSSKKLPSGGALYEDVTTGYGPECFAIDGNPTAYPYRLAIHYYSRGPMGFGMGKVEILEHDGHGGLSFDERPFVVMNDQAFVDLGQVAGPLAGEKTMAVAAP